jgi:hypothetical protein
MKNYIQNIVRKAIMDAHSNRVPRIMVMIDKVGQNVKVYPITSDDDIDYYYDDFAVLHDYKFWIFQLKENPLHKEKEIEDLSQSIYEYIWQEMIFPEANSVIPR